MEEEDFGGGYNCPHIMIQWQYRRNNTNNNNHNHKSGDTLARDPVTGHLIRKSNTNLVQCDDGLYTLHVGLEILEVDTIVAKTNIDNSNRSQNTMKESSASSLDPTTAKQTFAGMYGYVYVSQPEEEVSPDDKDDDDNNKNNNL